MASLSSAPSRSNNEQGYGCSGVPTGLIRSNVIDNNFHKVSLT
ncbi:hypothetical protein CCACVL1_06913 [Corchorus capsularis]|uniref:Uncharacterized protein n=1 Tax=Corchorus capsularis TaxID=210143 RepID=A0A1R3JBE6_COCAP|nr:hypothetical protein CCACVL1_06913 [Corchorus capsularis]